MKNIYPEVKNNKNIDLVFKRIIKFIVFFGSVICFYINKTQGGSLWSLIVIAGSLMVWNCFLSDRLVEKTPISFLVSLTSYSCIVLLSIGLTVSKGWVFFVLPMVCSSSLIVSTILFLTNTEQQKCNHFPCSLLAFLSCIIFCVGFFKTEGKDHLVMGISCLIALTVLIIHISILKYQFLSELKRRFHTL